MPTVTDLHTNFNRGELDPRLTGRKDLQAYYNGGRQMKNVTALVQGGARKRNGTEFYHEGSGVGQVFNFSFSTEVNYSLLFTDEKMEIFKDSVLQTNINGSGDDFLTLPGFTDAILANMSYIQSADTALLTFPNVQPVRIIRTSDTTWSLSAFNVANYPQYDFNDALSPAETNAIQDIVFTNQNEGDRYKIGLEGILSDEVLFAGDQSTNESNIQQALLNLPNTGGSGTISVTSSSITNYQVTLSEGSANSWDTLTFTPIFTEATTFNVAVTINQAGVSRKEPQWSVARGFPQVAVFHEGRLWFANSTYRPSTLWGSKVNFFDDFDKGKGRDDEAIEVTLDTDQVNAITGLISNRNLQVFTSGGAFYVPSSPITPGNVSLPQQANFGSKKVRPVTIDGTTLYVQRTGKALRNFVYFDGSASYVSNSVSSLASHLINDPIELETSKGTSENDSNYVYVLNGDGTLAIYNALQAEDVSGFTEWVTDGVIQSIAVVDDLLHMYVLRDGKYLLERENIFLHMDSGDVAIFTDTLANLSHLEGETVVVVADNVYKGEFVVSGGAVTVDAVATLLTGGINYTPIIETMPLNVNLKKGPNAMLPKRIARAGLQIFESNAVIANGVRVADKTMGVDVFDSLEPQTDLVRIRPQGYSVESTLLITQDEPLGMTILSAYLEVSV